MYWAEDSSEAIKHHGILGMKWGQRRYQYEDGSLTPEGRQRYLKNSSYSKKHDIVLAPGSTAWRIATDVSGKNESDRMYISINETDANKYAGLYARSLSEKFGQPVYQKTYSVSETTKIASEQRAKDILKEELLNDPEMRSAALKTINEARDKGQLPYSKAELKKILMDVSHGKITPKTYDALNIGMVYADTKGFQKKYFTALANKGYDGLIDINDKYKSGYKSKNPTILFNVGKIKLESIKELDPKDIDKMAQKEHLKLEAAAIPEDLAFNIGVRGGAALVGLGIMGIAMLV